MNIKNNKRSQVTDEHIIRAVYRAIAEEHKPLARITVREICEETGINRSTFYAHYQDVYDVVEKTEKNMSEKLTLSAIEAAGEFSSMESIFERVFAFVREHSEFYRIYFSEMHHSGIIGIAWNMVNEHMGLQRYDQLGFRSQAEMEYTGVYFIHGVSAMLRLWIETGCMETPRELVVFLVHQYQWALVVFRQGKSSAL